MEDGGVGARFIDVVWKTAHQLPEDPRYILPEAVEVEGEAEEDDQVWYGHAGEIQVGGGLHVLEALDNEDGHGVAGYADDEEQDANGGDRNKGGGWEERVSAMVVLHKLLHIDASLQVSLDKV